MAARTRPITARTAAPSPSRSICATGIATDSFGNTDTLSGIENIIGTALADTITANVTNGLNNAFSGGAGTDTVTYAASTNALTVNLSAGTVTGTGVGTDTLTAIEIIRTGSGNDIFSAGAGGLGGVTTLDGGAGNDTLTTSAATLDLTGKTLTSIEQITTTNAAGTAFTTGSIATALLIQGAGTDDSVTLTGAAFSEAQRTQLFSQGFETIIDTSGTYTVNHAPTAVADTGNAQEDGGAVTLTAASLLANDTDPDAGDTKTLVSVNGTGALGSVSIDGRQRGLRSGLGLPEPGRRRHDDRQLHLHDAGRRRGAEHRDRHHDHHRGERRPGRRQRSPTRAPVRTPRSPSPRP